MARILIVGGYGVFGKRLAELLARARGHEIIVAGRDGTKAARFASALGTRTGARLSAAAFDASTARGEEVIALRPAVVVNASGPFQNDDACLARAAISAGCHYVDLADARGFVARIGALDQAAREAGVTVISGASTVPGVSSAVVGAYQGRFRELHSIEIGISPGNSFDPGVATTESILAGIGRPIVTRTALGRSTVYGWQGLGRHAIGSLGLRWMSHVEVPDLDLLPARYPALRHLETKAGTEVGAFHLGLWTLSWLVRGGLIGKPERLAHALLTAKRRLYFLGSDRGGMYVVMRGASDDGGDFMLEWQLIAGRGHGPFVPVLAAAALVRRLTDGPSLAPGARPCFDLLPLDEILAQAVGLEIRSGLVAGE